MKKSLNYSTTEINREYLIKVSGRTNNGYINKLVGVRGLLDLIGIERANKMLARAYACTGDVCRCKVYGSISVSFYIH